MKKLILALTILLASCTFTFKNTQAEELTAEDFELYLRDIPIMCGHFNNVMAYLTYYDFKPYNKSVGKAGAVKDGQRVYAVVYYLKTDKTESVAVIGVPGDAELCMMYRTFELEEFDVED